MSDAQQSLLQLRQMLRIFVEGTDRSIRAANEIERVLVDHFDDDEELIELQVALASYQPGGGEYLYDADSIRRICADALAEIESRLRE